MENALILEELTGMMQEMVPGADMGATLEAVLVRALRLLRADRGDVALWRPSTDSLVLEAVAGPLTTGSLPKGACLPSDSFMRGLWDDPMSVVKCSGNVAEQEKYFASDKRTQSELAVKISLSSGHIGVLNAESFRRDAFDCRAIETAQVVARFASSAITFAGEEFHVWKQLNRTLRYSVDEQEVLKDILESLYDLYGFDSGVIYTLDEANRRLQCRAHITCGKIGIDPAHLFLPLDDVSFARWILDNRRGDFIPNTGSDPRIHRIAGNQLKIRGPSVGLPLKINEGVFGVLLVWTHGPREITAEHLHLLEPFARLAALKIQHAEKERELRRSIVFYRTLADNIPGFVFCKDAESRFTFANRAFCEEIGASLEKLVGKTDVSFYEEALARRYQADDRQVIESKSVRDTVEPHRMPGGEMRYVHVVKVPIFDENGKPVGIQGFFRDITSEYRESEALRQQTQILEIQRSISRCTTLSDLYRYCVYELPRLDPFKAKYASILTFAVTTPGASKKRYLVLRASSHPPVKTSGSGMAYDFDPQSPELSLTEWVATADRPLRLHNLENKEELNSELNRIDPRLRHRNRIQDSDRHDTFLAVPISLNPGSGSNVLGVLRITQKENNAQFSVEEELLLQELATHYIAPKLAELSHRQFTDKLVEHTEAVKQISLRGDSSSSNLPSIIEETLKQLFNSSPNTANVGKGFWVTRLCEDSRSFVHAFICAVGLDLQEGYYQGQTPLHGTVTGHAIRSVGRGYCCVTDFAGEGIVALPHAQPELKCALACPIMHAGRVLGVVGIVSTSYDIDQIYHGKLIELVASEIAQALVQTQLKPTITQAAFRHDTLVPLQAVDRELFALSRRSSLSKIASARRAAKFCLYLAQAYCRTFPSDLKSSPPIAAQPCDVVEIAQLAKEWAVACQQHGDPIEIQAAATLLVRADPNIITAVLFNLLRNAREYGRGGSSDTARIVVSAVLEGHILVIRVSDHGLGMSESLIEEYLNYDVVKTLRGGWASYAEQKRGLGLRIVSFLVKQWVYDGVWGSIEGAYTDKERRLGAEFIVRLPVRLDGINKRSNSHE